MASDPINRLAMLGVAVLLVLAGVFVGARWASGNDAENTDSVATERVVAMGRTAESGTPLPGTTAGDTTIPPAAPAPPEVVTASAAAATDSGVIAVTGVPKTTTTTTRPPQATTTAPPPTTTTTTAPLTTGTTTTVPEVARVEDRTAVYEIPCVGSVTVEVKDGRLGLVSITAPGWDTKIDADETKVKVEFFRYDHKAMIEIELDNDEFKVKIENSSDDCHDFAEDRREVFDIPDVGSVTVEVKDGRLGLVNITAPGWDTKIDADGTKVKVEFFRYDHKAMLEIELDDYEFKVKIENDSN